MKKITIERYKPLLEEAKVRVDLRALYYAVKYPNSENNSKEGGMPDNHIIESIKKKKIIIVPLKDFKKGYGYPSKGMVYWEKENIMFVFRTEGADEYEWL